MRKWTKHKEYMLGIALLFGMVSFLGRPVVKAEERVDAGDITFSAAIYEDANRTQKTVDLSADGASLSGWEYNTDRYLGVEIDHMLMTGEEYQIVIEMAPVLYLNQNTDPVLGNTSVSFEKNADFVVNTDSAYQLKTYSLSNLTYKINPGTESMSFGLPLRFDNALWNKQDGALLGNGTDPLLRVYFQQIIDGNPVTVGTYDVNLLQVAVSGSISGDPSISMYSENDNSYSTSVMGMDEKLKMYVSRSSNTSYKGGYYYPEMEVELTIPFCTVDGVKYTLDYSDFRFSTSGGTSEFSLTEADGVLTMRAEKFFMTGGSLFSLWYQAPEEIREVKGVHKFLGSVTVTADGLNFTRQITVTLDNSSQPMLGASAGEGDASVFNNDVVQHLGKLALNNAASFSNGSGPLEVELTFDSNNTGVIGVTSVQLMCDRDSQTVQVWYTLVDAEGNIITDNGNEFTTTLTNKHYEPDSTDTDNKYQLFNRSNLPEEYRSYYFKTLRYTIGNLDGGTYAYHTGAGKAPYSAGTIWGYVTTDTVPAERPKHEMKVYQVSGEEKTELTALRKTTTVKIDAGTSVSYGIDGATLSSSKINAGDPVKIGGSIFVPSYPYTSNNCLNGIRLGFLLPDGMTVNEASIVATYKGGTLEVESVTSEIVGTNQTFWIVSFKEGNKIGHYNEKLEELDTGSRLNFSVQFNTDRTMSTQTLNLREFVFAAGAGIVNGSGGSYSDHACVDDYDLNGNGKTTDTVACYGVESTQSITIEAVPPQLEIEDELEIGGFTGSSLTMNSSEDVVYYKFDLKSTKGGRASGFYYLIPIANGILEEEEDFLVDQNNPEFKLALGGPVSVTHEAGTKIKVYYTTNQTINSYADALQLPDSEWFTDIPSTSTFSLAQEGTKWSDVTMIKIVADDPEHPDDPVIVNGSQNVISIPLVYDGNYALYKNYAGMKIQWKSRGYYGMELGYNGFSGTLSTEGCTVTINYVEAEPREITLTAAKNGTPVGAGAVNIDSFTLPEFILAQEYTIGEIKVTNVNLVDGSYNFAGASGSAANTDFRINVSVKDEAEQNAAVAIFAEGTFVGKLDENSAPTFTFSIQNADALSDIVTERYVELTLFGSNGVIVPVKIIIKRELAAAEDPKPAIVSGKLYLPMSDTTTVIKVSQDSAFTAQFITEGMIPANYFGRKVVFEKALEAGTQITMIDWTDANSPGYYHYTVRNSTTTSIMLTEFTTMGGDTKYVEPTNGEFVNEQLMFIIQLPKTGQKDIDNNMCLRKTKKPDTEGAEPTVEDSDKLSFSTKAKRTFSLNTNKTAAKVGEEFVLTYTSAIGDSLSDSRFTGRGLALVIGASAGYTVPAEARLVVGGEVYTLNSEGKFVVPLDAVQKGNGTRTVRFLSETAQSVKLSAELWASATGSTQKVLMGEQVAGPVTVAVTAGTMPSFKVSSMSDRLLYPQDLMSVLTVLYEQQNATKISVEVQMKDAAGYITQSGAVEAVDGKTEHSMGVFNLANMDGSVALKLSVNMRPGTYRILFTVTNQNGSIKVPYYFIVAE